ncbi:MAG: helix-turn-helix transcriptional regulator [Bacteroidales bacterium]|jgi:putative transcriptional regulator|nr:helix-turn-helix transcriptional regulator [Bacteroidales bacterium]MCU0408021.1 helix-turn-helix transcriptional regulator [Bacteroidales bacterium]
MNNRIREYRAKYNLTQDDLAKRVNVRRETIVFLEKNKYNPSLKLAHDIAIIFESRIEDIFIFE